MLFAIYVAQLRIQQSLEVVVVDAVGVLRGVEEREGGGEDLARVLLCAAEVVVGAHTLLGCAVEVVVVGREADKRVGGDIDIVFIEGGGVEHAIAGTCLWLKHGISAYGAHSGKGRVGVLGKLTLGGVEDLCDM